MMIGLRGGVCPSSGLAVGFFALVLAGVPGCSDASAPEAAREVRVPAAAAPQLRVPDGLAERGELQEILEFQLRRDGSGLVRFLASGDPAVRARAALALGSVQGTAAVPALRALLADPDPGVRGDAAFALGQISFPDAGEALLQALEGESDPRARGLMIEALGKVGAAPAIERLVALAAGPLEEDRALALGRALLRGVDVPSARAGIAALLGSGNPKAREGAAHYFAQGGDPEVAAEFSDLLRATLDGSSPDDPATMHLVVAIAQQRAVEDLERLLHWLERGEDWRTRVNVARVFGSLAWIEREGVRDALLRALDDPVEQVAVVAAASLTRGLWVPPWTINQMEWVLREGPIERWRVHAPFITPVSRFGDSDAVLTWTRRVADVPLALAHGLAGVSEFGSPELLPLILRAVGHPDPWMQTVGVSALVGAWQMLVVTGTPEAEIYGHLLAALEDGPLPASAYAASALVHPAFAELGGDDAVWERWGVALEAGDLSAAEIMAALLLELGDPEGPELLAAVDRAAENLRPDWELLAELGAYPRVRIETTRGEIVARLSAEEAPLTVQSFTQLAREGRHDGVPFHRLEPNFLIQGGDVAMGDGSGNPGFRIPSEFTTIPFRRGAIGMASRGKDTEGSQFFLVHSTQPHLDGAFTAFGWIESGLDVLDRLGAGDRVVSVRVEPDPDRGG